MFHIAYFGVFLLPADNPPQPVAMILTTKGEVTIRRARNSVQRAWAMTLLQRDDQLSTPPEGEVTLVFLADSQRERVKPNAKATVHPNGCSPVEVIERLNAPKLPPANLESLRGLAISSRGAVGVLRGDPPPKPQVVTPLYGSTILTDRPALNWPNAKADAYLVQLFSGGEGRDQRLLWKAIVKEMPLVYPAKEKPLQFGLKYRWSVIPLKGDEASAAPIVYSEFLILPRNEIQLMSNLKPFVASKDPENLLLAAVSYEANGVYDEALRLYERLAKALPGEANIQLALSSYYERAGRKDLAQKAQERARKLKEVMGK